MYMCKILYQNISYFLTQKNVSYFLTHQNVSYFLFRTDTHTHIYIHKNPHTIEKKQQYNTINFI